MLQFNYIILERDILFTKSGQLGIYKCRKSKVKITLQKELKP